MLSKLFFSLQSKRKSLSVLRDLIGHSPTFILFDSGVKLGETQEDSDVGSGGIQGGCPDPCAWQQHSKMCVIPARYPPVQLTTQAGSTPCHVLLISFCIKIICTSLCTVMYTNKCKVAMIKHGESHISYVSVWVFSLCMCWASVQSKILRVILYLLLWYFVTHRMKKNPKSKTHTVSEISSVRL